MAKSPRASRAPKNYDPRFGEKKRKPRHGAGASASARSAAGTQARAHRDDESVDRERPTQRRGSNSPRVTRERSGDTRSDRARSDRARSDRSRDDRSRDDRPRTDRSRDDHRRDDRRRDESTREDRPRDGRVRDDRARDERTRPSRNRDERSRDDRSRDERPRSDRSSYDRPRRDRDRDWDESPRAERPRRERPERAERSEGPRSERQRPERSDRAPRGGADRAPRGSGPKRAREAKGDRYQAPDDVVLDRFEANLEVPENLDDLSFADLGLGQNICRELSELGAEHPFPIQAATIPMSLTGRDVLGRGRTGSGKTIAFGAPLVERLLVASAGKGRRQGRPARALIMAPTRELAMQIDRTVQPIARSVGLFTATVFGGVPQHKQNLSLSKGVDILIATPGRLEDMVAQGRIDLGKIDITILDEADHMCDLGFLEPVQRIMRQTNPDGQRMLFSATLDAGVGEIVSEFLTDPGIYEVPGETQDTATIDHRVFVIDPKSKLDVIATLVSQVDRALVFTRTRAFADSVADGLDDRDVMASSLHGDLSQAQRTRALERFSRGRVDVLVATDVAARGIHVDDVDLVVQADPPDDYKTYLHRAGRTGRAGKTGVVVTLIGKTRQRRMSEMLERAGINAPQITATPGDASLTHLMG